MLWILRSALVVCLLLASALTLAGDEETQREEAKESAAVKRMQIQLVESGGSSVDLLRVLKFLSLVDEVHLRKLDRYHRALARTGQLDRDDYVKRRTRSFRYREAFEAEEVADEQEIQDLELDSVDKTRQNQATIDRHPERVSELIRAVQSLESLGFSSSIEMAELSGWDRLNLSDEPILTKEDFRLELHLISIAFDILFQAAVAEDRATEKEAVRFLAEQLLNMAQWIQMSADYFKEPVAADIPIVRALDKIISEFSKKVSQAYTAGDRSMEKLNRMAVNMVDSFVAKKERPYRKIQLSWMIGIPVALNVVMGGVIWVGDVHGDHLTALIASTEILAAVLDVAVFKFLKTRPSFDHFIARPALVREAVLGIIDSPMNCIDRLSELVTRQRAKKIKK